jgi:hypothetical protein
VLIRACALAPLGLAILAAAPAYAQFAEFQLVREGGANIDAEDVNPNRELVLVPRSAYAHSGLNFNLSNGSYLQPVSLPLGIGYGLIDNLELGAELALYMNRPDPLSFFAVGSPRLYGRYGVLPRILALELSVHIPVGKDRDALGLRFEAPFRYAPLADLFIMGAATWSAYVGATIDPNDDFAHFAQLGAAIIYRFVPTFWAAVELGMTVREFDFDSANVPLGFAAGVEVMPGIAVLPGFRFPDAGKPENRVLQLLVVYAWDFEGARTAEGDTETPEIPLPPPSTQPQ